MFCRQRHWLARYQLSEITGGKSEAHGDANTHPRHACLRQHFSPPQPQSPTRSHGGSISMGTDKGGRDSAAWTERKRLLGGEVVEDQREGRGGRSARSSGARETLVVEDVRASQDAPGLTHTALAQGLPEWLIGAWSPQYWGARPCKAWGPGSNLCNQQTNCLPRELSTQTIEAAFSPILMYKNDTTLKYKNHTNLSFNSFYYAETSLDHGLMFSWPETKV